MTLSPVDPVLPIVIVPLDSGKEPEPRPEEPPDLDKRCGCVAKTRGIPIGIAVEPTLIASILPLILLTEIDFEPQAGFDKN